MLPAIEVFMTRRVRLLPLLGWTMAAACSGGGEETRGPASSDAASGGDAPPAAAPVPSQSMSISRGTVPMTITGRVARHAFEASAAGECATSAESSIYEVPATQWHAVFGGGDRSNIQHLNLTVWRPRSGAPDMVNLALQSGEISHRIATVKGGELVGSGTAGVRAEGRGGTVTVSGKDDHGHDIELSVRCDRFDEVVAEGG
jgi:hypothetical protein